MTGGAGPSCRCAVHQALRRAVAVNDLSFDVTEHEVMGLIGPNGSGKSTTLNLISGALPPTAGTISLRGSPISGPAARRHRARGVARTFQLVRLLPSMTVLENVMAGAVFGHRRRWGAEARAQASGCWSGGPRRTRALARGPAHLHRHQARGTGPRAGLRPDVLLLDEWLAGLNPTELQTGIAPDPALARRGAHDHPGRTRDGRDPVALRPLRGHGLGRQDRRGHARRRCCPTRRDPRLSGGRRCLRCRASPPPTASTARWTARRSASTGRDRGDPGRERGGQVHAAQGDQRRLRGARDGPVTLDGEDAGACRRTGSSRRAWRWCPRGAASSAT
jgi:ABC-type branched-subunit amino acid transport system ATPase component